MANDPKQQQQGLLLVNKPRDWTSHDVVKFVRRFGFKKVGHAGTLDPAATGLLVLLIGRATKLSDNFSKQDKIYAGVMSLGVETFSHDSEGEIISQHGCDGVTEAQIREVVETFIGPQDQVPPMVSAVKVKGKKLYTHAREGVEVERESRPITIHRFEIHSVELPDVRFTVECTKGTYVRTLCSEVGKNLGCGAYLKSLERLASGKFSLEDAYTMDEIKAWDRDTLYDHMIPLETAFNYI